MKILRTVSSVIASIGAINWGLVGVWRFDAVAWICGGADTVAARIIYTVVGICGIIAIVSALIGCAQDRD